MSFRVLARETGRTQHRPLSPNPLASVPNPNLTDDLPEIRCGPVRVRITESNVARVCRSSGRKAFSLRRWAAISSVAGSLITRIAWVYAGHVSARNWRLPLQLPNPGRTERITDGNRRNHRAARASCWLRRWELRNEQSVADGDLVFQERLGPQTGSDRPA